MWASPAPRSHRPSPQRRTKLPPRHLRRRPWDWPAWLLRRGPRCGSPRLAHRSPRPPPQAVRQRREMEKLAPQSPARGATGSCAASAGSRGGQMEPVPTRGGPAQRWRRSARVMTHLRRWSSRQPSRARTAVFARRTTKATAATTSCREGGAQTAAPTGATAVERHGAAAPVDLGQRSALRMSYARTS